MAERRFLMGQLIDLTNMTFGDWKVLGRSSYTGHGFKPRVYWDCKCVRCGTLNHVDGKSLRGGVSKTCNCHRYDFLSNNPPKKTHGKSRSRLYRVWTLMRQRCQLPSNNRYKHYGGRGISVCDEWNNSFSAFEAWALSHGYDSNAPRGITTIDRIDVNGNYTPENCRFVDMKVQAHNKQRKGEF